MARDMIARTLDAGLPCAWVLADALYGADSALRRMLEDRRQPYVLAVRSNHTLRFLEEDGLIQTDPAALAEELEADAWSPCPPAKAPKARGSMNGPGCRLALPRTTTSNAGCSFAKACAIQGARLLFRPCPKGTSLAEIAGAAGLRWTIEECFLRAKDDLGLDHCEARSWHGWHRHMSLVMAAAAFLAKLAADQRRDAFGKRKNAILNAEAA